MNNEFLEVTQVDENRYMFGQWLRRALDIRGIRIGDFRTLTGIKRARLGKMMKMKSSGGQPEYPTAGEIALIASVLDVEERAVERIVERAKQANETIIVTKIKKGQIHDVG